MVRKADFGASDFRALLTSSSLFCLTTFAVSTRTGMVPSVIWHKFAEMAMVPVAGKALDCITTPAIWDRTMWPKSVALLTV